jgi:ABC-type bacteriocin/lantibiotic exporter with double-glycine peptidase domain
MINLSWQLAIIIIVIAVLETLIMFKVSEKIKNYSQNIQGKIAKANELFIDIMKALRFIRVNSISNLMLKKYSSVSESVVKYDTKRNTRYLFMNALSDLFKAINLVGVFFIGIYLNYLGAIDLGTLMAFLILQDGVSYMINNLSSFFGSIQQSAASIERVIETINNDTEECLFENESSVMLNNYAIKGNSFSFYYDESTNCVFDGADIFIPSGKTTKIVGMSGSGKSTLVKLLMGFYPLRDGELSIGGYSYNDIGLYHVRECISYVGQTAYLFHDTIEENIRCGNDEATFNEIEQAAIKAGAHEFINEKELGYKTMVYEGGVNFSGGQRQRLTLARAFLKHAPVLLIDEATSALDQKSEFLIYKFIEDQRKEGKTILYITHKEQDYEKYVILSIKRRFILS